MAKNSHKFCLLVWLSATQILFSPGVSGANDLCFTPNCSCEPSGPSSGIIGFKDVICECHNEQEIRLSGSDSATSGSSFAPNDTLSLTLRGCSSVTLETGFLNDLARIRNVSLIDIDDLKIMPKIYSSRGVAGARSKEIQNFEINEVKSLSIKRQAFVGISVVEAFWLKESKMRSVGAMTFNFDFVNEFSIFGCNFDRVSMWGFSMKNCKEFNILGMSRFYSVAKSGFQGNCEKMMMTYNTFVNVQRGSFDMKFTFADIQGNTFDSITGPPFYHLVPRSPEEIGRNPDGTPMKSGFIFSENKFTSDPVLPFGVFAMPAYEKLDPAVSMIRVENNHFSCACDKLPWFIGSMELGVGENKLEEMGDDNLGYGSLRFHRAVYDTAGSCLNCNLANCEVDEENSFKTYAAVAASHLRVEKDDQVKCSSGANAISSNGDGKKISSYNYENHDPIVDENRPTVPTPRGENVRDNNGGGGAAAGSSTSYSSNQQCIIVLAAITSLIMSVNSRPLSSTFS